MPYYSPYGITQIDPALGGFKPTPEQLQAAQYVTNALNFVQDVTSGKWAERGIRPTARGLAAIMQFVPQYAEQLGDQFNPMWVTRYLPKAGSEISPNLMGALYEYASAMGELPGGGPAKTLPEAYRLPSGMPAWRQQAARSQWTLGRLAEEGIAFNPFTGRWEPTAERLYGPVESTGWFANLLSTIKQALGIPEQKKESTTVPATPEAAGDEVKGLVDYYPTAQEFVNELMANLTDLNQILGPEVVTQILIDAQAKAAQGYRGKYAHQVPQGGSPLREYLQRFKR